MGLLFSNVAAAQQPPAAAQAQQAQGLPPPAPSAQEPEVPPGTFKIPGTRTTLTLSGYAQLDVVYDFKARDPYLSGHDYAALVGSLPLNNQLEGKKSPQLHLTARTSRVGVQVDTPSEFADFGARIEADFWSGNLLGSETFTNSVLFRLRHGYGTVSGKYGTLLVGQTWSTLAVLEAFAETVDFNGPGAGTALRNPMIRYTAPLPGVQLTVAAENAPGTDRAGIGDPPGPTRNFQRIPDFVARVTKSGDWGSASVGAVTIQYKNAGPDTGESYSKQGWGAMAAGALKIFSDTLRANVTGGRGVGRYIFAGGGQGVTDTGDSYVLWDGLGYHVNYTHVWSPQFRSNLVWSQTLYKNNHAGTATSPYEATIDPATGDMKDPLYNQRIEEAYVNTFWTANRQVEFGLEYGFGQRHTFGNDKAPDVCTVGMLCQSQVGTMHRITTTAHFSFF